MNASPPRALRPQLGDFASIICTKAIVVGLEEALGERAAHVALLNAGRLRGRKIAEQTVGRRTIQPTELTPLLNEAIGIEGTRLCIVDHITEDGEAIRVSLSETLCSAGEPQGSPRALTFTMGAVLGVFEVVTGRKLRSQQVESVLRGGAFDTIELTDRT
jgi:hypothetical protein